MAGETGPVSVSLPIAMVMAGFFAVAMFNTGEILLSIFRLFRRRRGLYFWSLLIASFGIPVHSIAVLLRFFALAPNLPMCVVTVVGWWAMVTGQSLVLCSRLHLVVCDLRKIRWSFILVATNFCILHIPVSILFLASNSGNPEPFLDAFNVYEKIQLAGFSLQESILSGLYLWEAIHGLKPLMDIKGAEGKSMIRHLVILFVVVVVLDISLMTTEYTNNFQIQTTYKPVVYSVKLKIEMSILNRLIAFTRMSTSSRHYLESNPAGDFSHSSARGVVSTSSAQPSDRGENTSVIGMGPIKKHRTDHIFDGRSDPSVTPSMPP